MMILFTTPAPVITSISAKDFKARFTSAEIRSIVVSALTDDDLHRYVVIVDSSNDIDLTDQETVGGVDHLVSLGLLTQARADSVLAF